MDTRKDIHVVTTGLGNGQRDDLLQAMADRGWTVTTAGDAAELANMAASGHYHLAVLAHEDPHQLPIEPVRKLLGLQIDMATAFLVPEECDVSDCIPLMGATSDHVHKVTSPISDLMESFQHELESALSNQPEYTVICVDDDEDFVASLQRFLSARLQKSLPRFLIHVEAFTRPTEALEDITEDPTLRPAVMISDQMMPEMNGIDLLHNVKKLYPDTRCVLLTGHAALDSAVTAINERILDKYFFKPVDDSVDFTNNIQHLLIEHHLHSMAAVQRCHLMSQFEFIRTISASRTFNTSLCVTREFLHREIHPQQVLIALEQDGKLSIVESHGHRHRAKVGPNGIIEWVHKHRLGLVAEDEASLPAGVTPEPHLAYPLIAQPLIWGAKCLGVVTIGGPTAEKVFTHGQKMLLSFVADVASATISAFNDRRALEDTYVGTMATLVETVEAKDSYTRGHTERVREVAVALAKAAGVDEKTFREIRQAAELHDVGKIGVPDEIISKPGALTSEEYDALKKHSAHADQILQHLRFLDHVRITIRAHHERYDGGGYPDGLTGEEIPFGARVIAIADSFDAMTSTRPYRKAMSFSDALAEIEANAGTQFDPKLAKIFVDMMNDKSARSVVSAAGDDALPQGRDGKGEDVSNNLY